MGRKIYMTESQVNEIIKKLNEDNRDDMNFTTRNFNMPLRKAVDTTRQIASTNSDKNVTLNGVPITSNTNPQAVASQMQSDAKDTLSTSGMYESCVTKKQIKEAKLKKLRESSVCYSKKQFQKKLKK